MMVIINTGSSIVIKVPWIHMIPYTNDPIFIDECYIYGYRHRTSTTCHGVEVTTTTTTTII